MSRPVKRTLAGYTTVSSSMSALRGNLRLSIGLSERQNRIKDVVDECAMGVAASIPPSGARPDAPATKRAEHVRPPC